MGARIYFETAAHVGAEMSAAEMPELQAFFDANPAYWQAINGRPPRADEAAQEYKERVPAHLPHGERWFIAVRDRHAGALVAMANVTAHLVVADVWHIGLFIVATARHGTGEAAAIHAALERAIREQGAQWLRLGVVAGNARAEAFWAKTGYVEARVRHGIDTGGRFNDIRVMLKPLGAESIERYLERVPRDRPGAD